MNTIESFFPFFVALGLGLIIGLERERRQKDTLAAGIRTLPLIALLGAIIQANFPDLHIVAFSATGILVGISYYGKITQKQDPGLTTAFATIITYILGSLCTVSPDGVKWAVIFGTLVLTLLTVKDPLHHFANQVEKSEMIATLKFAIISLVILPLLPNQSLDVLLGLNPQFVWLMVVLVSGIGFGAYLLTMIFGTRYGIGMSGLLGGLISSTATTVSMAEQSIRKNALSTICSIAVVLASLTMFPRILIEVGVVHPPLLPTLIFPLMAMVVMGLLPVGILLFIYSSSEETPEDPAPDNPFRLKPALIFGAFFAVILLLTDYANATFGHEGMYVTAVISGLMDVDAITLSLSRLDQQGEIPRLVARNGIIIGAVTNTIVKVGITWLFGTRKLATYVTASLCLSTITGVLWLILL